MTCYARTEPPNTIDIGGELKTLHNLLTKTQPYYTTQTNILIIKYRRVPELAQREINHKPLTFLNKVLVFIGQHRDDVVNLETILHQQQEPGILHKLNNILGKLDKDRKYTKIRGRIIATTKQIEDNLPAEEKNQEVKETPEQFAHKTSTKSLVLAAQCYKLSIHQQLSKADQENLPYGLLLELLRQSLMKLNNLINKILTNLKNGKTNNNKKHCQVESLFTLADACQARLFAHKDYQDYSVNDCYSALTERRYLLEIISENHHYYALNHASLAGALKDIVKKELNHVIITIQSLLQTDDIFAVVKDINRYGSSLKVELDCRSYYFEQSLFRLLVSLSIQSTIQLHRKDQIMVDTLGMIFRQITPALHEFCITYELDTATDFFTQLKSMSLDDTQYVAIFGRVYLRLQQAIDPCLQDTLIALMRIQIDEQIIEFRNMEQIMPLISPFFGLRRSMTPLFTMTL